MHLNPQTIPHTVRGKTVFHESGPCAKKWGTTTLERQRKKVTGLPRQSPPISKPDWSSSRGTPRSDLHSLPFPLALLFGSDTQWELQASAFQERLSGFRGNSSHRVQFPSRLSVVSPETPGRASSKQACAVTRVPGRTKGFNSQQSYMPLFFFFSILVLKGTGGGGETTKLLACLEMVQSELEPGTCPAWQPRHGHSSKRRLYFIWRRRSSVQNTLFLCAGKCSIFEMTGGKKKGRQGRFRKMRPTPCWGILKCHPGLQREKQSKRKNKLLVRGNTLPCQTQLELIHTTTS